MVRRDCDKNTRTINTIRASLIVLASLTAKCFTQLS